MNKHTLHTLTSRLAELSEAARTYADNPELHKRISEIRDEAESLVRMHPVASVAIGVLVGYLLGKLLSKD